MAITILEKLKPAQGGTHARLSHNGSEFRAVVVGDIQSAIGSEEPVIFEMDYRDIVSCRTIPDYDDHQSGLWQREGELVALRGRVHAVHELGDDVGVDMYLLNGPEFFFFRASDASIEAPELEAGLELEIRGVRILVRGSSGDAS